MPLLIPRPLPFPPLSPTAHAFAEVRLSMKALTASAGGIPEPRQMLRLLQPPALPWAREELTSIRTGSKHSTNDMRYNKKQSRPAIIW